MPKCNKCGMLHNGSKEAIDYHNSGRCVKDRIADLKDPFKLKFFK